MGGVLATLAIALSFSALFAVVAGRPEDTGEVFLGALVCIVAGEAWRRWRSR